MEGKMKRRLAFGLLILVLIAVPLLASCAGVEPTEAPTAAPEVVPTEKEAPPPTEVSEPTEAPAPTVEAHWWDEFGEPQYGGTITIPAGTYMSNFDTYSFPGAEWDFYYETLFQSDWTLDRSIWPMNTTYTPEQYLVGHLVESWEVVDPQTVVLTLRQGIHWQDKPPVNGRELTAADIQAHYDRQMGIRDFANDDGTPNPAPMLAGWYASWESVTATDTYTFEVKFKSPTGQAIANLADPAVFNEIEAPEWVALSDEERADWHNAVGTGPWMLTDFVEGSSLTFSKNPNYWGTDPRYPENQLPYADTLEVLIMPDQAARQAALRTGQIDIVGGGTTLTWPQMQAISSTNPEMQYKGIPAGTLGVKMRLDEAPFTDIRVRQALNMAIDRAGITESIFGGAGESVPCGLITSAYTGYAYAYEDWPQELKDAYAYNPEGAKALLAEAAADGIFTPNELGGFDTEVLGSSGGDTQYLEIFKSEFLDIGVNMEITLMETAAYEAFFRSPDHHGMVTGGGGFTFNPMNSLQQFWSEGADQGASMVDDPDYDALYDQYLAASGDEAMRISREADKHVIENHWLVTTGESYSAFNAWQPWIKGASGESLFWGCQVWLSRIWIDQSLR
jgi:peptide/nickel transport system substrate-binding protein